MESSFHTNLSKKSSSYHVNFVNRKWRKIIIASFFIEMFISNFVQCYGIIGNLRIQSGHPISEIVITPCIYCIASTFLNRLLSDVAYDSSKSTFILLAGVSTCFSGMFLNIWFENIICHSIFYGLFLGIGSSLIRSQLNNLINSIAFTQESDKIKITLSYSQALGHCIFPYIYMIVFHMYGRSVGYLLLSSIVLQSLPAVVFIIFTMKDSKKIPFRSHMFTRGSISHDSSSEINDTSDVPLENLLDKFQENKPTHYSVNENTLHIYHVLPEILEVNEDIENEEINHSYMEDNLNKINNTECQIYDSNSIKENNSSNKWNSIESECRANASNIKVSSCNLYVKTIITLRRLNHFIGTFLCSLNIAVKTWELYPVLLLRISTISYFFTFSTLVVLKSLELKSNASNIALLLSTYGFFWLLYLILTPCLKNIKKSKCKVISSFGSLASSIGLFMMFELDNFTLMCMGSALCGMGYGALSKSNHDTSKDYIGITKWPILEAVLESIERVSTIGLGVCLSRLLTLSNGVSLCFQLISSLLFFSGTIWIMIIFIEAVYTKKNHHNQHIWPISYINT